MKLSLKFLTAAFCLSNLAIAADFTLEATGSEPLYQSALPVEVYQLSRADNLRDLTISNAAGEQVPYALLPYYELHPQTATTQVAKPLNFFPLKESSLSDVSDLTVQMDKIANNTSVKITTKSFDITPNDKNIGGKSIYLIDAGKKHPPLQTISIDWQGAADTLLTIEVLASDDLKNWSNVGHGVLLKTTAGGKALEQASISLDNATQARYLQIRGADNAAFYVNSIKAEYNSVRSLTPDILWQAVPFQRREAADKNGNIHIDFEAQGRYAASYLRVKLPQNNTITSANVLVRNKNDADWQILTSASLYRMSQAGNTYTNPDIAINTATWRYWRLQFNQADGGIGQENPSLALGWLPQTVVWNARGAAPFSLQVGTNQSMINAVSVTRLIADYKAEKVLQLPIANIALNASAINQLNSKPANSSSWSSTPDYKTWLLWAGLALGVLLLAGMAYSLVKGEKKE